MLEEGGGEYIHGAITTCPEISYIPGVGVPRKDAQPGLDLQKFHVQELEGHDRHPPVVSSTTSPVW